MPATFRCSRLILLVVAAALAGSAVAVMPTSVRAADRPSEVVAVFNFAQRDADPQHAWLSKGLADLLINQLAGLPDVAVVSRDRMQSVVAEYQRTASKPVGDRIEDLTAPAAVLEARRILFGTYAVREGRAVLTLQATAIDSEKVLFETKVEGQYADVLDLQRELSRRTRAYLLGKPVDQVPLDSVPQWSSNLPAAEHLYAGVDLFDRGEYAEAWLRFRQSSRSDGTYADALYWQGRMFYYLLLYDNARPLLDDFFTRFPRHPRAGDAAIELLDSYRQTVDDPRQLRDIYVRLRDRVDPVITVHNKSTPGRETETLLRTYIGGFLVQAERAMGNTGRAAELAVELQTEARRAFDESDLDEKHWGFYDQLARTTAMQRRMVEEQIDFNKKMFPDRCCLEIVRFEPNNSWLRINTGPNWTVRNVRQSGKYRALGVARWDGWLVAPPGFQFDKVTAKATFRHFDDSRAVSLSALVGTWNLHHVSTFIGVSDAGSGEAELDLPYRCQAFYLIASVNPPSFGALGGVELVNERPIRDYVESLRLEFKLKPLADDGARIRVHLGNVEKARVYVDGRLALLSEGTIHGVAPGQHVLRAVHGKGQSCEDAGIYKPVERTVTVADGETVDCDFSFAFNAYRASAAWTPPVSVAPDYPVAQMPPQNGEPEASRPSLLRVQRGALAGQLVAIWSYREELWLSYSQDDGASWKAPGRLPIPVNSAHQEMSPQLLQDESGRFVLAFISDRNIDRAFYPYAAVSDDLVRWSAPHRLADAVCDSVRLFQDRSGRYVLLLPPPYRGEDWAVRLRRVNASEYVAEHVDVVSAFGKKYGRKTFALLVSDDLHRWSDVGAGLGTDNVREADMLQTNDGRYHAVYTQVSAERGDNSVWDVSYQHSDDLVHWGSPVSIVSAPWPHRTPSIATDGKRVFGAISISGNNTHWFEIGRSDVVGWWGFASQRSVLYHDPAGYSPRLHWLWLAHEDEELWYAPQAGRVFYSSRPSDRGEWLFEAPAVLPPDSPEEARSKQEVLARANNTKLDPRRPWSGAATYTDSAAGFSFLIPGDWVHLDDPKKKITSFIAPVNYGPLQPAFEVLVLDAADVPDIQTLGRMAVRRWWNFGARHVTLATLDHPSGRTGYLIVFESEWVNGDVLTKQCGFLVDGKEIRVSTRCPVDGVDEWMPILNRIFDSFRFGSGGGPPKEEP